MVIVEKDQMLERLKSLEAGEQIVVRMTDEQAANLSLCLTARSALEDLVSRYIVGKPSDEVNHEVVEDILQKYIAVASDSYEMVDKILFDILGEEAFLFVKDTKSKIEYRLETINKLFIFSKHVCSHCK